MDASRYGRVGRRGLQALLVLALASALTTGAAAGGNVSAFVDGAGDLWLFGDDLANGVRLESGGADQDLLRIRGLDASTTINGLASVTLFAPGTRIVAFLGGGDNEAHLGDDTGSDPPCCQRELVVVTGAGRDQVVVVGPFERVTLDLGPGDDTMDVGEGASGIVGTLRMGTGDDRITIGEFTGADGLFDLGAGNDQILVGQRTGIRGRIELGDGDDLAAIEDEAGALELFAGTGNDRIELTSFSAVALVLDAGPGADVVHIAGDPSDEAPVMEPLRVDLGGGDDRLLVGHARMGSARLDGDSGLDRFLDLGGNAFTAGAPELVSFEAPKGQGGPVVDVLTTIAGRVVDERGTPVAGANVALPQRGLATLTGADGTFAIELRSDENEALELVAGATVDGRPRAGAALTTLTPLGVRDVGDVVVGPLLRNVLVFGAPRFRGEAVEANLLALGLRPEQVSLTEALPADLSPYGAIWHVGSAIGAGQRARLVAFVGAGGGLFLSGGPIDVNASVETLVNQLVVGGGVDVGVTGSASDGLCSFQPGATGGAATVPNALTTFFRTAFTRYVTGLAARNELVRMDTSSDVPFAVWGPEDLVGHRGRLLVVTNTVWIVAGERLNVFENLQRFLRHVPRLQPGR